MLTIVHLLGPESSSHSHILTVSTQQVNRKMLQVQKTLYASNLQSFIEIQPRISRLHCCGRTTLPDSEKLQRSDTQLRIRAFCPGIFAFLAVFRVVEKLSMVSLELNEGTMTDLVIPRRFLVSIGDCFGRPAPEDDE